MNCVVNKCLLNNLHILEAARHPNEQPPLTILNEYLEGEQDNENEPNDVCNRFICSSIHHLLTKCANIMQNLKI